MSETRPARPATFTLEIDPAVSFEGRDYRELILREPTAKEVLRADELLRNGTTPAAIRNREIHLMSFCAGVPLPVIEKLRISTHNRGMSYILPFLTDGQETGEP